MSETKGTEQKTKLADLRKLLDEDDLEFMPKQLSIYNGTCYAQILPYKNARTDMYILDEVVGVGNWQNEYKRDAKGLLQCGIGIYIEERKEWIWKWSNGTESQFEKEKGEYSDAFKRAGVLWGIGRCLYDFPNVRIQLNEKEYNTELRNGREIAKGTGWLKPNDWNWEIWIDEENGTYEQIVVTDKKGNVRFNLNPHKQKFKDPENRQNFKA